MGLLIYTPIDIHTLLCVHLFTKVGHVSRVHVYHTRTHTPDGSMHARTHTHTHAHTHPHEHNYLMCL